jgi:hypothetical protein
VVGCGLDLFGLGLSPMACSGEHGNKLPSSIKGSEFLDQLSDC